MRDSKARSAAQHVCLLLLAFQLAFQLAVTPAAAARPPHVTTHNTGLSAVGAVRSLKQSTAPASSVAVLKTSKGQHTLAGSTSVTVQQAELDPQAAAAAAGAAAHPATVNIKVSSSSKTTSSTSSNSRLITTTSSSNNSISISVRAAAPPAAAAAPAAPVVPSSAVAAPKSPTQQVPRHISNGAGAAGLAATAGTGAGQESVVGGVAGVVTGAAPIPAAAAGILDWCNPEDYEGFKDEELREMWKECCQLAVKESSTGDPDCAKPQW